jgi:hypothetical protein
MTLHKLSFERFEFLNRVLETEAGRTYSLVVLLMDSFGNSVDAEDCVGVLRVVVVGQNGSSVKVSDLDPHSQR